MITVAAMSAGKALVINARRLKSSLHFKVEDDFVTLKLGVVGDVFL